MHAGLPMARKENKGCFLFYVYGFCLGLGSGLIATIFCFTKSSPVLTRILLPCALMISVLIVVVHLWLTCSKQVCVSRRELARYLLNIIGLSVVAGLTCTGTFVFLDGEGLFFLCGIFSAACYIMSCIAFTVNIIHKRAKKQHSNSERNPNRSTGITSSAQVSSLEVLSVSTLPSMNLDHATIFMGINGETQHPGYSPANPSWTTPDGGNNNQAATQLALSTLSSPVILPSYEEVTQGAPHSPPKYSEIVCSSGTECVPERDRSDDPACDPICDVTTPSVDSDTPPDVPPPYDDMTYDNDRVLY